MRAEEGGGCTFCTYIIYYNLFDNVHPGLMQAKKKNIPRTNATFVFKQMGGTDLTYWKHLGVGYVSQWWYKFFLLQERIAAVSL